MSMNFFVDCEFEESTNQLISLAIISEDGKHEFYEALEYGTLEDKWVEDNIIPLLKTEPLTLEDFQNKLEKFCSKFAGMHIIVNHPNDVIFFNIALRKEQGDWIKIQPLTFEIDDDLSSRGATVLHNALSDTRAMRVDWFRKNSFNMS